jgi:sugar-specific transcriptional regulator TrmB
MTNDYLPSAIRSGLGAKAAAVYVSLLQANVALSPKSIILQSGLHRQYVYDALQELKARDLVITLGSGRTIKYRATSPDTLLQTAEKQRLDALEGVRELMKLYDRSPAGIVEVIRGSEAVIADEFKELETCLDGSYLDIVGGAGMNFVSLVGDRLEEWEEIRKEKSIVLRYIGGEKDVEHNRNESIIQNQSRSIPGIGNIVNVSIRPGSVSFNIYQPEILTVRVRNEAAVASQRALFEVLWNVAK